ncbi:tripartite tricarboxylate transporter substrate binding protein [Telmatospirillum sp. J64-1]|uniref:tripartite tricarboxylate transporter substrate binding protein n=1 Tax=Telmatospirillum sp. J64-1 TaxID=2502183 RepID=UPI001C8F3F0B|nr:tripartite tricarboxylate transporter substrate binding protein [Telmatospirillum sp. J64-1]
MAAVGEARAAYPGKPIEWIVMWSAGGGADTATRVFAKYLEAELGQSVVVKNVTGAGGTIGYLTAKTARADGYTLVSALSDLPKYKPLGTQGIEVDDFEILGGFALEAPIIVARADAPWSNIREFAEDAKNNPGKYSIGVSNVGGVHHQPVVLWMEEAEFEAQVVSHPGSPQMNAALLGGHVDLISSWVKPSLPGVQDGQLKYLAYFATEAPPGFDSVPTFQDEGYQVVWPHSYGMGAPKGIPDEAKQVLVGAMEKVWENPDFEAELNNLGLLLHKKNAAEYRQELLETEESMGRIVELLND